MRHPRLALLALAVPAVLGCAGGRASAQQPPASASPDSTLAAADTASGTAASVPAGFGSLRQDDIAFKFQIGGKQVKILPLDEGVIRTLSPDSYRALRNLQESKMAQVNEFARRNGAPGYSLWYVQFHGIEPDARFSPREITITSGGREYRPIEVLPLSPGFGQERLRQRETQHAVYLFENTVNVDQPLVVTVEGQPSMTWTETLRRIERERALIRSRSSRTKG